jgi:hypothetical protein
MFSCLADGGFDTISLDRTECLPSKEGFLVHNRASQFWSLINAHVSEEVAITTPLLQQRGNSGSISPAL